MIKPTPILFTIPNFMTAGSGRAMLNIVERLDRGLYAPAVCVSKKGGKLDDYVQTLGIPLIEAPFTIDARPYRSLLWRAWQAAHVFRPYHFALWHSFHYADDYTEPIIARFAGARTWIYTKKNMNWHRRSWLMRTLLARAVAAQNTDMLREFFGGDRFSRKTRLIPRGVDIQSFRLTERSGTLHNDLGIPQAAQVVGTVGHLVPVKGHPTLLDAIACVPQVHLLVAGKPMDQSYYNSLREMACTLNITDRVHWLGGVEDVATLLAEIDIFVLPTWARWRMEGSPVALLEAMACGKPCIATDIPGSRDLIEHERSGLLVPPEDPQALAAAINRLSNNPELASALGQQARKRAIENFSIEREVTAHEELYASLVSTKGRPVARKESVIGS